MAASTPGGRADLRAYYEREAELGARRPLQGHRVEVRTEFLALLAAEGRVSVLDAGAGPGLDGGAFVAAGHRYVGIDLAGGNARLAAAAGSTVVQGSIAALPIRPRSFDAGWSFSTLMHLSGEEAGPAMAEIIAALRPGAPLVVGTWGRESEESYVDEVAIPGRRRAFHLRSFDRNRALLADRAAVEWSDLLPLDTLDQDYHLFGLRVPA